MIDLMNNPLNVLKHGASSRPSVTAYTGLMCSECSISILEFHFPREVKLRENYIKNRHEGGDIWKPLFHMKSSLLG